MLNSKSVPARPAAPPRRPRFPRPGFRRLRLGALALVSSLAAVGCGGHEDGVAQQEMTPEQQQAEVRAAEEAAGGFGPNEGP